MSGILLPALLHWRGREIPSPILQFGQHTMQGACSSQASNVGERILFSGVHFSPSPLYCLTVTVYF